MKQPARLTLTLQREDKPLPFGILSYYRRRKLISLALLLKCLQPFTGFTLKAGLKGDSRFTENLNPTPTGIRTF